MPKKISAETRANASPLAVADAIAVNKTEKLKLWQKSQKSKNWNLILSHIEHFRITPKFPAKSLTAWNQEWTWQYQRMVTGQRWQKSAWVNVGAKKTIEFKLKLQYHLKVTVRILKIQICVRIVPIEIPILAAFEYSQLKICCLSSWQRKISKKTLILTLNWLLKPSKKSRQSLSFSKPPRQTSNSRRIETNESANSKGQENCIKSDNPPLILSDPWSNVVVRTEERSHANSRIGLAQLGIWKSF